MFSKEEAMNKFKEDHPDSFRLKPKCNIETCEKMSATRGLCSSHYSKASYLVKTGVITKEELEEKLFSERIRNTNNQELDILKALGKL